MCVHLTKDKDKNDYLDKQTGAHFELTRNVEARSSENEREKSDEAMAKATKLPNDK